MGRRDKPKPGKKSTVPASEGNQDMSPEQTELETSLAEFDKGLTAQLDRAAKKTGAGKPADLTLPKNPVSVGSRVKNPEVWAAKQIANSLGAGDNWLLGVLNPRRNPIQAGIEAEGKYQDRLKQSMTEKRRVKGLQQVDVEAMYETIEEGGPTVYTSGIERRKKKITSKVARLQPLVLALAEELDKMPQDTDTQREAKMIAAKRGMQKIGLKLRGIS